MPIYNFRDSNSNEEFVGEMKIAELEKFLKDNPHIVQLPSTPLIISGRPVKPDSGFRDVLKKVKASHPLGNFDTY